MAYIGFSPSQLAIAPFATKYFTGDGATTTFTLDQSVPGANEANVEVFVENVQQNPVDAYTIGGALNNQLIFSEAPVVGGAVYVIHKGEATYNLQPSTGSVTAATLDPVLRNFTVDKFTGDGTTKTFTLTDTPYSPNSVLVVVDGITQTSGTNYNVTGNTLTFDVAPTAAPDTSSNITVIHMGFSSGNKAVMDASITPVKLSLGGVRWDTNYNAYIGTSATNETATAVQGNLILSGANGRRIGFAATSDTHYIKYKSTTIDGLDINGYSGVVLSTGSTSNSTWAERVRLDISGNLGLGTSPSPWATYKALDIGTQGSLASAGTQVQLFQNAYWNGSGFIYKTTNFASQYNLIAGQHIWSSAASGTAGAPVTWYSTMSLDNAGLLTLPYGQIKFPAVQNASSDPNTLDDYEEGTWTPTYSSGITGGSTPFAAGRYIKTGRNVVAWCHLEWVNGTLNGSHLKVSGLPFTSSADSNSPTFGAFITYSVNIRNASNILPQVYIGNGTTEVQLYDTSGNTLPGTGISSGNNQIRFVAVYPSSS